MYLRPVNKPRSQALTRCCPIPLFGHIADRALSPRQDLVLSREHLCDCFATEADYGIHYMLSSAITKRTNKAVAAAYVSQSVSPAAT
jgi:hypothetical protein